MVPMDVIAVWNTLVDKQVHTRLPIKLLEMCFLPEKQNKIYQHNDLNSQLQLQQGLLTKVCRFSCGHIWIFCLGSHDLGVLSCWWHAQHSLPIRNLVACHSSNGRHNSVLLWPWEIYYHVTMAMGDIFCMLLWEWGMYYHAAMAIRNALACKYGYEKWISMPLWWWKMY